MHEAVELAVRHFGAWQAGDEQPLSEILDQPEDRSDFVERSRIFDRWGQSLLGARSGNELAYGIPLHLVRRHRLVLRPSVIGRSGSQVGISCWLVRC